MFDFAVAVERLRCTAPEEHFQLKKLLQWALLRTSAWTARQAAKLGSTVTRPETLRVPRTLALNLDDLFEMSCILEAGTSQQGISFLWR